MTEESNALEHWQELSNLVQARDEPGVVTFLHALPPEETAYTLAKLGTEGRTALFELLSDADPDLGADLLEHFSDDQAALVLEELAPADAAALVDEMDSDEQTDVLVRLDPDDAEAILERMEPEEAADATRRLQYPHESAGGLMITEYLAYHEDQRASDVVRDLHDHGDTYQSFEVRHLYVIDAGGHLVGTVPLRRLVMSKHDRPLSEVMAPQPVSVTVDASLNALEDLFDRIDFTAVPVLDEKGVLLGVVQRAAVQEALSERASATLLKFGGIIGGEETRSMPYLNRTLRRLAFLLPNILLSYAAVSIIAIYEPVIHKMTALAVFIPMVANLSGAAGNQAVAVSIRELSLGLLRPNDVLRIWRKEATVGLLNGVVIGLILAALAWVSRPEAHTLAVAVGGAYALNSVLAVVLGGLIPLGLTRLGVDPAMLSSPILATLTDMGSFLLTLSFAALLLHHAAGL